MAPMTKAETYLLYNTFPLQKSQGIKGQLVGKTKRVYTIKRRPYLAEYNAHWEGRFLVGGIPGSARGEPGWVDFGSLDLDELDPSKEPLLREVIGWLHKEGIPVYPSRGLTRGCRLWILFDGPTPQREAYRFLLWLKRILEAKGLGRVEIFPSAPKGGKSTFLPYYGGINPLLTPDLQRPIPPYDLPKLKRFRLGLFVSRYLRLREISERIAQAPRGTRHNTLLAEGLKAYALGLPKALVRKYLQEGAKASGLLSEDEKEVDRLLTWLEDHATPRERKPLNLGPLDLEAPLFAGRRGRSRYLILKTLLLLAEREGRKGMATLEEGGKPEEVVRVMASYRRIAYLSGVSLKTTHEVLNELKDMRLLEGYWDMVPERGTVWTIPLERLPFAEGAKGAESLGLTLETLPLLSPQGLGFIRGQAFLKLLEGGFGRTRDLALSLGISTDSARRALHGISRRFSLGHYRKWLEGGLPKELLERALRDLEAAQAKRYMDYAEGRAIYREAIGQVA